MAINDVINALKSIDTVKIPEIDQAVNILDELSNIGGINDALDILKNINSSAFDFISPEINQAIDMLNNFDISNVTDILKNLGSDVLNSIAPDISSVLDMLDNFSGGQISEAMNLLDNLSVDIPGLDEAVDALENLDVSDVADTIADVAGNIGNESSADVTAGALVNTETNDRITFDINPSTVQDNKSNNLAEINIPGMSHPRLQFTNGSSRKLTFTLFLHYGATSDVPKAIKLLQSWLYPEYEDGRLTRAPAKLMFVFGDTWPDEIWILQSCNVERLRFTKDLKCNFAQVEISLIQLIEKSISAKDVKGNA